jgi:hypothetical protein
MKQNHSQFAPEAATDEPVSSANPGPDGPEPPGFDPVPLRYRTDGLTPAKQRDYVEALADTGVAREAAARIGVSEQAINRVRRRADAKSFDLACEAAARFGARRIRSIAFERAIGGSVKRHYYHGELKSEEVVYDNRLLVYLLGRTEHLLAEPAEARAVADNWEPFVEAMEQGLPPPDFSPSAAPDLDEEETEIEESDPRDVAAWELSGNETWMEDDGWYTRFPPPEGFDGFEDGLPGEDDYVRECTVEEAEALRARDEQEYERQLARAEALRDLFFGFDGGRRAFEDDEGEDEEGDETGVGQEIFSPREAETNETSRSGRRKRCPAARGKG